MPAPVAPRGQRRPRLSIVVPCYNEESCLDLLYERVTKAARGAVGEDYEIVLIDDGSRDGSWEIMRRLGEDDACVLALRLSRNHGHQLALSAGLDLCHGNLILILDADLQDPPELLGAMIARLQAEQADVVYAVRGHRHGETWFKRISANAFYRLLSLANDGTPIPLDTGDFRLMTRRALDVLQAMPEQSRFIRGMVAWIGFKQVAFTYEREERFAGQTNYPFVKMMRLALDAVTGFSSAPLRLASYAGMLFALMAFLVTVYSLANWMMGTTVEGWTSLIVVVLVIGSVQLFVLGMMGEYIGRLYNQSKQRPLYIVSDVVGDLQAIPARGIVAPGQDEAERPA
jgi:polyisoprenyl-phosphate glycosyltransferase